MNNASFHFHGNLIDFITSPGKKGFIHYSFTGMPSIKDAIESIGIPHTEVKEISTRGHTLSITETLYDGNCIEVYPFSEIQDSPDKFILDVHLGKLARLIRLMGFDVLYENHYSDKDIIDLIIKEQRVVLTRDKGLLKHKAVLWGYWLRSQDPYEQLKEVYYRYQLKKNMQPFSRCLLCNGLLHSIEKEKVEQVLPPRTKLFFHEFYQCQDCGKVYWKGSHYERMLQQIKGII